MKKRLLAAIMSLCMIVSLLPVSAFAAPWEPQYEDTYIYEVGDTFTINGGSGIITDGWEHKWTSKNDNIASVNKNSDSKSATVTCVAVGNTVITHTYSTYTGSYTEHYKVIVNPKEEKSWGKMEFGVYYRYDNRIPDNPQEDSSAIEYGPSGNDKPLYTITIDIDKLLTIYPEARTTWENAKYISYTSCGAEVGAWWENVLSCMDETDQAKFDTNIGRIFQGYILKRDIQSDTPNHMDGILTEEPPLYTVELYENNAPAAERLIEVLYTDQEGGISVQDGGNSVRAALESYLETEYGTDQVNWTSVSAGSFTADDGKYYQIALTFTPALGVDNELNYEQVGTSSYYYAKVVMELTEVDVGWSVTKTVDRVLRGGQEVTANDGFEAQVGDQIFWKIEVTNEGEAPLSGITLKDELNGETTLDVYSNADCSSESMVTGPIDIAVGKTKTYYATYTVQAGDSGRLSNTVTASLGGRGEKCTNDDISVQARYTLTVESYLESTSGTKLDGEYGGTYPMAAGTAWSVEIVENGTTGTATHSAPKTITVGDTTYSFDPNLSTNPLSGTMTEAGATVQLVYSLDEKGGETGGDGIPDKYQKQVTFKVVNGTWADGTRTDKIEYVTLTDESGKYSESGKGSLNAPTGMIADTGFQNGTWDTVPPTEVSGTTSVTYIYTFSEIPVTYYNVTFNTNGGTTPSWSQSVVQGQAVDKPTDPVWNDDYIFMGWTTEPISGETYGVGENLPGMVFQNGDSFTPADNTTLYAVWGEDRNHDDVADVYEVFIAPADITIYTGGTGYEGVSDGDGNEIENSNSGLPEPGFHIILPADLGLGDGNVLNGIVKFQYYGWDDITDNTVRREWDLSCVGVYSAELGQFVYSLVSTGDTPAVRVTYTDENDQAVEHDRIDMSANAASAKYDMSINAGGLEQNNIEAVITVGGREVTRSLVIGTGELTIRSTVDRTDNTNTIADNAGEVSDGSFNAVGNNASYVVNDSEVPVSTADDRVQLLVDQVSNSTAFNNAMGEAAVEKATVSGTAHETVYLDLVDTQNGNTVVTLDSGSMDIYWPMPSNADPYGDFQVVHYVDMNREVSASEGSLDTQETELLDGTAERINGDWYVRFTTHSFSPFVLVYEEDTSRPVNPNPGGGSGGDSDSDPTGNLSIELDVNGGDDEFTFTVILTDKDGDDLENNFYYNGDYTGTIGSGDEITLESGEKIVIRNLPEGTRYEVIIETADGYTYVIDGEEGVIHTGMNEAEFAATRTVPVADPSVTGVSRWLNTTDHIAYLTGYPGGAFGPDNNMTRAEVAQMFYALLNNKNVTITKTFPDVPADAWYATAVNTLASLGMVSGDEHGSYRPNDPITRAEFCVIALAFAYEPENAVCYFGDVSRSDWFYTYVAQAASYGWIGGYTNGNFGPNDRITRAQVTTIVNNMLGRAADRDYVIDHQADLVQFTDLTRAHWGYFQIMEATNAHDYTKSNGTENWR